MQLLFQPRNSHTCGQYCLAMIATITVNEAIVLVNKPTCRGTRSSDLINALRKIGFTTSDRGRAYNPLIGFPEMCIFAVKWKRGGGHWMAYKNGVVHCPGYGRFNYSDDIIRRMGGKTVNYIKIEPKSK